MNENQDDKLTDARLDRLLGDWAAAQRPDEAHLEALQRQISEAAGPATAEPRPKAAATWPARLAWFALGAAAAIVAAVLLVPRLIPHPPADPNVPGGPLAGAGDVPLEVRFDRQQLASKAALFEELREVFAGNLAWMAEADGKVVLGVASEGQTASADPTPITIRLVVMARKPGEADWHRRTSVDVILCNEELVQFGPEVESPEQFAVWAHLLPDGMIAVDTSLDLESPQAAGSSYSGVQQPSVHQRIFTLKTDEAEYRVFQTVAVLPKEVG